MPNPFINHLRFRFLSSVDQMIKVEVFNTHSVCLFSNEMPVDEGIVELSWDGRASNGQPLPAGIYLLRITAGNEILQTRILKTN